MTTDMMPPRPMTDPKLALAYLFSGDATLTFKSVRSGTRYTFRIQEGDLRDADSARGYDKAPFYVKVLVGQDNENDYAYMGMITFYKGRPTFRLTAASARAHITENDQRVKAFRWSFEPLLQGEMPHGVEITPSIKCARCGRKLTDPNQEGFKYGYGLECYEIVGSIGGIMSLANSIIEASAPAPVATSLVNAPCPKIARPVRAPRPTPKEIVAAVDADPEIKKMAEELWEKNPNNPKNQKPVPVVTVESGQVVCSSCKNTVNEAETIAYDGVNGRFCSPCQHTAEALAKSQMNWTVAEAAESLGKRTMVNLTIKRTPSKAEESLKGTDVEVKEAPKSSDPVPEFSLTSSDVVLQGNHALIESKIQELQRSDPDRFNFDGIMDVEEAHIYWYGRFSKDINAIKGDG